MQIHPVLFGKQNDFFLKKNLILNSIMVVEPVEMTSVYQTIIRFDRLNVQLN